MKFQGHDDKENKHRLAHEDSLPVHQQPPASASINHPIGNAKIPAGACYQNLLSKVKYIHYIYMTTPRRRRIHIHKKRRFTIISS